MIDFFKHISIQPWITFGNLVVAAVVGLGVWWIRGIPDRMKAENERRALDNSSETQLRKEMTDLNAQNRKDIHDLRDKLATAMAAQHQSEKDHADQRREYDRQLMEAASVQRESQADMDHLLFVIQCLLDEVKRLDPDPEHNRSIQQAEAVLLHMAKKKSKSQPPVSLPDPSQSKAMNTAKNAVDDAKQSLASSQETCREIKRSEEGSK